MEPEPKSEETMPPRSSGTKPDNSNSNSSSNSSNDSKPQSNSSLGSNSHPQSNSTNDSKSQPNLTNDSGPSTEQKPDLSKVDPKLLLQLATPTQTKRKNPHTPAIICAVLLVALVTLAAFLAFGSTLQNYHTRNNSTNQYIEESNYSSNSDYQN